MTAFGECLAIFSATPRTIPALTPIKSMRLIPGLRGRPAVMTTTSELAVFSYPAPSAVVVAPVILVSNPSMERDWFISRAKPSGFPSTISVRTTSSKMLYSARRRAVVEP